jgi:hypothetical protein
MSDVAKVSQVIVANCIYLGWDADLHVPGDVVESSWRLIPYGNYKIASWKIVILICTVYIYMSSIYKWSI